MPRLGWKPFWCGAGLGALCFIFFTAQYWGTPPLLDGMEVLTQALVNQRFGFKHLVHYLRGSSHPPLLYWVYGFFFLFCRDVILAANLSGLLLYSLVSALTFSLVARAYSPRAALLATTLLNLHPLYLVNSLYPQNELVLLLCLGLILTSLLARRYLLLGATLALLIWAKETGRVFLAVAWGLTVVSILRKEVRWQKTWAVFVLPILSSAGWRYCLARAGAKEWNSYILNGDSEKSSTLIVAKYLLKLDVFTVFTRQNLENTFIANYNWLYTVLFLAALGAHHQWGKRWEGEARQLARLAWWFAGAYLVVVYPFPTWTEPRYSLVVLAVVLTSLGVLLSDCPFPNLASGAAIIAVLFLLVSQRTSQDPITARVNGQRKATFYGVELDEWNSYPRGTDRFMYNLQMAEVARRQAEIMVRQMKSGAEVLIVRGGIGGFRSCHHISLFFDWPVTAEKYGKLTRPKCLGDDELTGRALEVAGKRVALLTPITKKSDEEILKTAKSVTEAFFWTER